MRGGETMEKVPTAKKTEFEFSIREGKPRIILNGLEVQEFVHRLEYQRGDLAGNICSSVEMQLFVPIL